jgi:hypothetical protein
VTLSSDWGALIIAALIGASVSWALCSLWSVRWIDQERRRLHDDINAKIAQTQADQQEFLRLKERENFNRDRA